MQILKLAPTQQRCNEAARARQLLTFNLLSDLVQQHVPDAATRRAIVDAARDYAAAEYAVAALRPQQLVVRWSEEGFPALPQPLQWPETQGEI
jgi:hypothetical protein